MKKFLKTVAGVGALAAFAGGIYLAYKKYVENDPADDLDDEEFDLFEGDSEGRSYVTLDPQDNSEEEPEDDEQEPQE